MDTYIHCENDVRGDESWWLYLRVLERSANDSQSLETTRIENAVAKFVWSILKRESSKARQSMQWRPLTENLFALIWGLLAGRWRSWLSHLSNTQKVLSSSLGRLIFYVYSWSSCRNGAPSPHNDVQYLHLVSIYTPAFHHRFAIFEMPLINSTSSQSPTRKRSIFSNSSSGSGLFRRRRPSSSDNESDGENKSRFLGLRRRDNSVKNDPSIRRALKKVADAQKAEKRADTALTDARKRVHEAQQHVQSLEQESVQG